MSDPRVRVSLKLLREVHACMRACGWHLAPANIADGDDPTLAMAVADVEARLDLELRPHSPANSVLAKMPKLPATRPVVLPSPDEVEQTRGPRGGWTREILAGWGVPWPAPKGWRTDLRRRWLEEQAARR